MNKCLLKTLFIIFILNSHFAHTTANNCKDVFLSEKEFETYKKQIKYDYQQHQLINDIWSPIYTAGTAHLSRFLRLGKKLRNSNIDPISTHIDELSHILLEYIKNIEQLLHTKGNTNNPDFVIRFKQINNQIQKRIHSKKVSYRWAMSFCFELLFLATGLIKGKEINSEKLTKYREEASALVQRMINKFPEKIFIPVPHNIGIIFVTRTIFNNLFPFQLSTQKVKADLNKMDPYLFALHDIYHGFRKPMIIYDPVFNIVYNEDFHQYFIQTVETLTIQNRKMAEWIYLNRLQENANVNHFWYKVKDVFPPNSNKIRKLQKRTRQNKINIVAFFSSEGYDKLIREVPYDTAEREYRVMKRQSEASLSFIYQSADIFENIISGYLSQSSSTEQSNSR